jgi:CheY-like chemotaxis protein
VPDSKAPIRVMVVDDEELICRMFSLYLKNAPDMEMIARAGDGEEAIRFYREHRPDVVLMDINMPVMNGLAATRVLCQEFPQAHVILVSADIRQLSMDIAREVGAVKIVAKPVSIADLLHAIRNAHGALPVGE